MSDSNHYFDEPIDNDHLRRLASAAVKANVPLAFSPKKNDKGERLKRGERWTIMTFAEDAETVEALIKETAK